MSDADALTAPPLPARPVSPLQWIVRFFASMKLAVVLVLSLALLTWLGTLAQIDRSTHAVQQEYFESWFVLAKLPVSVWGRHLFELVIPLPGAYPVLALLFLNLMVGGLVRMKWSVRNLGILVTHVGIALLLVAGFVKMHYSYAGNLSLYEAPAEGQGSPGRVYQNSQFVSFHDFELALLVDKGDQVEERVVPEAALWPARMPESRLPPGSISGPGRVVTLAPEGLPFTIEVRDFVDHARAVPKGPNVDSPCESVDGVVLLPQTWPKGTQPRSEAEIAGCYVTVLPTSGGGPAGQPKQDGDSAAAAPIRGIVWGFPRLPFDDARYPFAFQVDGVRYGLDLRHVVRELPFAVKLRRFQKLDHPGTLSPKDFRSYVTVVDNAGTQDAEIFMNNPLRRDGYVVYQTSWGPQPMPGQKLTGPPWYSVFEVSYNPSDLWPMLACFVIAAGLLLHFVMKLTRFLNSTTYTTLQRE